jgi:microcystin-dependent protein
MKKIYCILSLVIITLSIWGQTPQKMSYQAVIRNSSGNPVVSSAVGMKISILQNSATGTVAYAETQTATTNANGLVSIEIGSGTLVSGSFSTIDWSTGTYFIKTETDPAGGANYTISGTSQLLSVPYALHAKTAQSITGTITETDPVYSASVAKKVTDADTTKWTTAFNWGNHATQGYVKNTSATVSGNLMTYDGTNWVSKKLTLGVSGNAVPVSLNNMQPYLVLNYCIATQGVYPTRDCSEPYLGEISPFAFNFIPMGYAACNGQLLTISSNSALFSLLGINFGGNGTTTFGLPDLCGRVVINQGISSGSGLTNRNMGEKGGTESITLTTSNLPAHTHTVVYE